MKKTLILLLVSALTAAALAAPAGARKTIHTALYFHGRLPLGEAEMPENTVGFTFMKMDTTKPTNPDPKSQAFGWGNTACAGNHFFPQWVAPVQGTIVGDLKIVFTTVSNAQDIDVRLFPTSTQRCANDYRPPMKSETVTLPNGQAETIVVFKDVRIKAIGALMVQFSPTMISNLDTPGGGRILYDSTSALSRIEFDCIPPKGASACAP
ncbi:MAG TPA: hypothetical protein VE174_10200 [Actinomycetota bacterium]|nr:hypothetical protein [Actinomycetota bacterium]